MNFKLFKGRKSVILGVWAAPGAPETHPKGGGASPPTFCKSLRGPRHRPDPKMADFRSFKFVFKVIAIQSAVTLRHEVTNAMCKPSSVKP